MKLVDMIIRSLKEHPEKWVNKGYTLSYTSDDKYPELELWICSGFWFLRVYKPEIYLSFFDKCRLYLALYRFRRMATNIKILEAAKILIKDFAEEAKPWTPES